MVLVAIVLIGKGLVFILLLRKLASPIMETNLQHKTLKKKKKKNSPGEVRGRAKLAFPKELTVVYILMWRNPASLQVYF